MTAMQNRIFFVLFLCFWYSHARTRPEHHKRRQLSMKAVAPVSLEEEVGQTVTMHCPVKPTIMRMYKYIRRTKKGKDLENANRKLAVLLGLKYRWYKDGKAIRHHRSAWSMKLRNVQIHYSGIYTCKVILTKGGNNLDKSRNFFLNIYKHTNNGRPNLLTQPFNISLKTGENTKLECLWNNTKDRPQIRWLKWPADKIHLLTDLLKDIKTLKQHYEMIDSRNYEFFSLRGRSLRHGKAISYGVRLRLKNVQPVDSGMYTCIVRNEFGSVYRNFFVNVESAEGVAPYKTNFKKMRRRFMAWPASSSTKLKCYVSGDRPLRYQWYKDGKRLLHRRLDPKINTSTWTLRLRELVPSDSGVYTCVVSNSFGVFRHNITLKVVERTRSAPILQAGFPKNFSASKGENASFECIELVSGPLPDYRWYKWHSIPEHYPTLDLQNTSQYTVIDPIQYSTIRVKAERSYRYGGRLTLTNITEKDVGLYTCVVRNHIGFDYSSAFLKLDVNEGPTFSPFIHRPSSINVPATDTLTLNCKATGDPKPSVTWFKNDKPLATFDHKRVGIITSGYTLKLTRLVPGHSGNYSCNVRNSRGSISHTFNVNIKEQLFARPIILPSNQKPIKFGERYELKCTVISEEPLTVYWVKKVGTELSKKTVLVEKAPVKLDKHIYSYSYIIPKATAKDGGVYWCIARNNVGNSRRKFRVEVEV